ncbi:acyl-CoA carboxylase epsilon subunit [Streptomyces sp. NPDC050844]|uniref:acyl-CoA carboxylase epsilon subunit n=1 Tax=Streptomyces sp. NPDC050844 TaxID=3155790 RepID=UPI0033F54B32
MIRRHTIKVVGGSPNHFELAALTAVFIALIRGAHALRAPHSAGAHRAWWDQKPPYVPAHSWRSRQAPPPR